MSQRSLRTELLVGFGFLASAAVLIVALSAALLMELNPVGARWALVVLWIGSTAVIVAFGAWLVRRQVLRPLDALAARADALADGRPADLGDFDSREFAHLAERFSWMSERLLDARGQVVQSEKLAAIGQLAAGVAHEVRNPLGALSNYLEVLRRRAAGPEDILTEMQHEVERMDRIVRQLLDYSRPQAASPRPTLVRATLERVVELLRARRVVDDGQLRLELPDELPPVRMEPHSLEQVLVNLVLNARDARVDGAIRLGAARSDGAVPAGRRPAHPREVHPWRSDLPATRAGATFWVADQGPGVPSADRERVFDPFFTTKAPGEGTGLGLALVARSVHDAGGAIWVDDAPEGGAIFRVFVPFAEEA